MRTMLPMGRREVMSVSTTSFNPGARLITLRAHSECMTPAAPPPSAQFPTGAFNTQTSVPEWAQRAQEAQDSEDTQDPVPAAVGQREEDVHQRHEHQQPIQDVPAGLEVGLLAEAEAQSYDLQGAPEESDWLYRQKCSNLRGRADDCHKKGDFLLVMITLMAISRRKITVKT